MLISERPFVRADAGLWQRGVWPAFWVEHVGASRTESAVYAFRLRFTLASPTPVRLHVSADQRYRLWLDGAYLGQGPERGDVENWFFQTYELTLEAGEHILLAHVWWLAPGHAPGAQCSVRPAFLLAAEGAAGELLNTGTAPWESCILHGFAFAPAPGKVHDTGARMHLRGAEVQWDLVRGDGAAWMAVRKVLPAIDTTLASAYAQQWRLRPSVLPPMLEMGAGVGKVRHVEPLQADQLEALKDLPIQQARNLLGEVAQWQDLISFGRRLTIPPRTARRVVVDLEDYVCGYLRWSVSGGMGSVILASWAEGLYDPRPLGTTWPFESRSKTNRDEIEGKVFNGVSDRYEPDGGGQRELGPLWWSAGRYVEVVITTADAPLTLEGITLVHTGYPWQFTGTFACDDPRHDAVRSIGITTLRRCTHETFMDCPHYEQLQYIGDTRLQALVGYTLCADDRLARKALEMFDVSRSPDGLTRSRYPCRDPQTIPPFSLWWVAMVHDYAMWRDDLAFVQARMVGVRAVLEAFRRHVGPDGLLHSPEGWNFTDWVPQWDGGMPPGGRPGEISAALNWQLVMTLRRKAELEVHFGEPELAARDHALAARIADAAWQAFWDDRRGLLADEPSHTHFSEHTQVLALLSGASASPTVDRQRIVAGLCTDPSLARATIYFSHYLFEAYGQAGQVDRLFERLKLWFDLPALGLRTTIETPEPARSDCHAWGAHPLFHQAATILGIRPGSFGFRRITIAPQFGPLQRISGVVPHPAGEVHVSLQRDGRSIQGEVCLPPCELATLYWRGQALPLKPGRQSVRVE